MKIDNLEKVLKDEPKFRTKQALQEVFLNLVGDWKESISLPTTLREKLNKECSIDIKAEVFESNRPGSKKAVITLNDGLCIETVLMEHKQGRNTVCVSCQVGCPIGCLFCLTGQLGFKRNLNSMEIIEQVLFWQRMLKNDKQRVSNIVFMGMGEPFLNYDNVIEAVKMLNKKDYFNIGQRHISISTVGIPEGIEKLSKEKIRPNLAISLHACDDAFRAKIIPLNKTYSIFELAKSIDNYIKIKKQRVMFEYLMLKDYNDTKEDALKLAEFVKQFKIPENFSKERSFYFVNLIAYNEGSRNCEFLPSNKETILKFRNILEEQGIEVSQRYKFGQDIKAACGQLAGSKK